MNCDNCGKNTIYDSPLRITIDMVYQKFYREYRLCSTCAKKITSPKFNMLFPIIVAEANNDKKNKCGEVSILPC